MGCGNSKLIPDGEVVPARIRPFLRNRFFELRRRKNASNLETGTLSKKVLLKDTELEEENSMLDNTKSVSSSPNGSQSQNSLATQDMDNKHDKDEDSAIPLSNSATKDAKESNHHSEEDLKTSYTGEPIQQNETSVALKDINREDEGGENKKTGEEGRPEVEEARCIMCPGSPSFRVYFVEEAEEDDKGNVEMKDAGKEDVSFKKSPSHDRSEGTTCANFGKAQENKVTKKGKKGRSFKRVISKKRPSGVKNLLNVKSCYHLSCSGNDRASLLSRKAEA